jgi:hypothetical protein
VLQRWLQRHGSSGGPDIEGDKPAQQQVKPSPLGDYHLALAEVRTAAGKLYLCVAIDRVCTFAYAEWPEEASQGVAAQCLRQLMVAVPDKIHTVLPDNGIQFTNRQGDQ